MSLSTWIVLGIVSGFATSMIVKTHRRGLLTNIVLGIVGAVVGGLMFSTSEMADGVGMNDYTFVVALVGAVGSLATYHVLARLSR